MLARWVEIQGTDRRWMGRWIYMKPHKYTPDSLVQIYAVSFTRLLRESYIHKTLRDDSWDIRGKMEYFDTDISHVRFFWQLCYTW